MHVPLPHRGHDVPSVCVGVGTGVVVGGMADVVSGMEMVIVALPADFVSDAVISSEKD